MVKREIKISCIGISFIEPVIDLYLKLRKLKFSGYSKTQVSSRENGYSVSIIVPLILFVESSLNRIRYLEKDKRDNLKFFSSKFSSNQNLVKKLYEIYVLRDLIFHNHIWRISYEFDNSYNEIKIYQKILNGYGDKRPDKKYVDYVDKRKKITKTLKLNVNPIKINKVDVIKVFMFVSELFKFLEAQNKSYLPPPNFHFKYRGKYLTFYDLADKFGRENRKI